MIKIMIVDDMPIFLEYLRKCINWESYGFEICAEAADGKDAWEKIPVSSPDVVLTDITMPYMNGLDLSEKIVEKYPNIAVVLITGNDEFEYARRAVKIGVCDYIVKPFEKEELVFTLLKLQNNIHKLTESGGHETRKNHEIERALIYGNNTSKKISILENLGMSDKNFLLCAIHFYLDENEDFEQLLLWGGIYHKTAVR